MNQQIAITINQYQQLNLSQTIDYDKFNQYAIVHHSTTIEGSTLTEVETRLLIEEGITPKGKPLLHSLMVQDHFNALLFILKSVNQKQVIDSTFIKASNSHVINKTGSVYQTVFGELDAAEGVFRKGNDSAGNSYFVVYDKVEILVEKLCATLRQKLPITTTVEEQLLLSFDAHFDLVTIHPFYNGNGRTSRLLMNFIQLYF
jgi:Fic family protein